MSLAAVAAGLQDRRMPEVLGIALLVVLFIAAVVAAGVLAEIIWSGRAGPRLAHFRWSRFFLTLWVAGTAIWAFILVRVVGITDPPSLVSAIGLPSAFSLALGVALRWVFAELPRSGFPVADPRGPELEKMLAALTTPRELALRLALCRISAHCLRDRAWKARIAELRQSLAKDDLAAAETSARELEQRLLADYAAAWTGARRADSAPA
jgi:hypothetical protein